MVGHRHIGQGSRKENQRAPTNHQEVKSQGIHYQTRPRGAAFQSSMGHCHSRSSQLRPQTPRRRKIQSQEMAPQRRRCNKATPADLTVCPGRHTPSDEKKTPFKTREGTKSHQTRPHWVQMDTVQFEPPSTWIARPVRVRKATSNQQTV
jgi:hypothetical protein